MVIFSFFVVGLIFNRKQTIYTIVEVFNMLVLLESGVVFNMLVLLESGDMPTQVGLPY